MAYIDKETTAKIRKALKAEFPNIKFSVRKDGAIALNVNIMKSDVFDEGEYLQVNHYYIDSTDQFTTDQKEVLKKVNDIIKSVGDYYDRSDIMSDYFDCAFYYHIGVGTFDNRHQKV